MDVGARTWDIVIVGAGPVGLHAAHKAATLEHSALVIDKGRRFSRVTQAAAIGNIPGHPGISGDALLDRLREDVREFQRLDGEERVRFLDGVEAVAARRADDGFEVRVRPAGADGEGEWVRGRVLVLATGVVDRKPGVEDYWWEGHETMSPYVHEGEVGYCVLCEGWTVDGHRVAVVGSRGEAAQIALDLEAHFGGEVTLLTDAEPLEDAAEWRDRLGGAGVAVDARPIERLHHTDEGLEVDFAEGGRERFHKAFLHLGGWYKANNALAAMLGAELDDHGFVVTDENCEVRAEGGGAVRGLFAVGDVRAGRWKQIPIGWGDAETAVITAYAYRLPE